MGDDEGYVKHFSDDKHTARNVIDIFFITAGHISELAPCSYSSDQEVKQFELEKRRNMIYWFTRLVNSTGLKGIHDAVDKITDKKFKDRNDLIYKLNTAEINNTSMVDIQHWFNSYVLALSNAGFLDVTTAFQSGRQSFGRY